MIRFAKYASAAIVVGSLFAASSANAAAIDYTLVGGFTLGTHTSTGTTITNNATASTSTVQVNGATLTFNFNPLVPFPSQPANVWEIPLVGGIAGNGQFGYFTVSSGNLVAQDFAGLGFDLTVTQIAPPGNGNAGGKVISGSIQLLPDTTVGTTLKLVLNPNAFTIAGVQYTLDEKLTIGNTAEKAIIGGSVEVVGPPADSAPLPAVAPAAFLLIGGLGLRRNRKVNAGNN